MGNAEDARVAKWAGPAEWASCFEPFGPKKGSRAAAAVDPSLLTL